MFLTTLKPLICKQNKFFNGLQATFDYINVQTVVKGHEVTS